MGADKKSGPQARLCALLCEEDVIVSLSAGCSFKMSENETYFNIIIQDMLQLLIILVNFIFQISQSH